MARVIIVKDLLKEIDKKFKAESIKILELMYSLKKNPNKGKLLGQVGGILIKELKYKSFRFYFLVQGDNLKILGEENLVDLLLKFVRMSDKKHQQKVIDEIKHLLRKVDHLGF